MAEIKKIVSELYDRSFILAAMVSDMEKKYMLKISRVLQNWRKNKEEREIKESTRVLKKIPKESKER